MKLLQDFKVGQIYAVVQHGKLNGVKYIVINTEEMLPDYKYVRIMRLLRDSYENETLWPLHIVQNDRLICG